MRINLVITQQRVFNCVRLTLIWACCIQRDGANTDQCHYQSISLNELQSVLQVTVTPQITQEKRNHSTVVQIQKFIVLKIKIYSASLLSWRKSTGVIGPRVIKFHFEDICEDNVVFSEWACRDKAELLVPRSRTTSVSTT